MVITRLSLQLGIFLTLVCLACETMAQSEVALATRKADLQALSLAAEQRDQLDRRRAAEVARRLGIETRRELPNGRVLELQRIAPGIGPVFYVTNNVDAADTVSTDEVWPGGSAALNLDGNGMTLGEWDGGAVFASHSDLVGRVTQVDGASEVSEHSTHVAGTLIGAGAHPFYPQARGMAYAAELDAYDWNSDAAEMALAASNGLLVSNHSYGIAAGWLYIGDAPPNTWWWIGGPENSDIEDLNFGYYDSQAQLWDEIAWYAPYYLIVKASGNDRWDTGPLQGEEYTVIDQDGNSLFTSTLPRNPDCAPAGYDCLPGSSVAKNILTIGAVDDLTDGYKPLAGPSQVQMAGFSGWGPTDDGRIKPDLVGSGIWLVSAWPDPPYFAASLGTSMATPNITGSLILLQQHYEEVNGPDTFMRAATLKALAIHTADEAGGADGPDYEFGWGLLNTKSAAQLISEDGGDQRIVEDTLFNGGVDTVEIPVTQPNSLIKATLSWTDPPGTPPAPSLDPPDLMLVNDLDLRVRKGPSTWLPWVLDPASPAAAAVPGDNFRDNVEQVVTQVTSTGSYFVEVRHKGTLLDSDPQDYSLIISVMPAPSTDSTRVIDEDFSGGMPAGWTVDTVRGVPWTIEDPVPGDWYLDNKTGGSGKFAMVNNNFTYTITSLLTPSMDLSSATGVILRFDSSMQFSDQESINVDVSTNGGSSWTNVWQKFGEIGLPAHYDLDLTARLGGQPDSVLRFRYDTSFEGPAGYYWQIDNVKLDALGLGPPPPPSNPPNPAESPFPPDGETGLGLDANLNWTAGTGATSHDVYFGTDLPISPQGNQGGTGFDPGALNYDTTYYWRIDEVNGAGTTTGPQWSFTTVAAPPLPGQASGPGPANGAGDVSIESNLSWSAGSDAASHDVYFGTASPPAFQANQPGTGFEPGTLSNSTTYYWRIDEVNDSGTTAGIEWSFTTETASPPLPGPAGNPGPADGAVDIGIDSDLSWSAGSDAASHDVYFGTASPPAFQANQTGTGFEPGTLNNSTTYYWRIDEVNGAGTTAGTEWSFTTATPPLPPATEIHLKSVTGGAIQGARGRWSATLLFEVMDNGGAPTADVLVEGDWSNGANGAGSCSTNGSGLCQVQKDNVKSSEASVDFTVTNLTGAGMTYNPAANEASPAITVFKEGGAVNLLPNAVDDNYSTTTDTPVSGNVLSNDDPGNEPTAVSAHDSVSAEGGAVSMAGSGSFTYTPPAGYEGPDAFGYTIRDNDNELDSAVVSIQVDPDSGGGFTFSVSSSRDKGIWYADLTWSGASGSAVQVKRDGAVIDGSAPNNGNYSDLLGKKVSNSYVYEVCEIPAGACATDALQF